MILVTGFWMLVEDPVLGNLFKVGGNVEDLMTFSEGGRGKAKIEEFVSKDQSRDVALKGLDAFFRRSNARVGRKTWTRDDIHERSEFPCLQIKPLSI
ncbi:MAG: hypothetical protein JRG79_08395 [Deltaproteobacteria bacterium]|nr:hypothetical protein [Deltaproteobacteria bacterium]